jgi:phosphatidylglycerophosphatase A
MTGAVEGSVQVATGFMESLKREPLSLALVLMNLCLLLFFYIILEKVADQRKYEVGLLYADHKEVRDLLAKCVVPERRTENGLIIPISPPPEQ